MEGKIINKETGEPIKGAMIYVTDESGNSVGNRKTFSSKYGYYMFENLEGQYLTVYATGYHTITKIVLNYSNFVLNFEMEPIKKGESPNILEILSNISDFFKKHKENILIIGSIIILLIIYKKYFTK